MPGWQWEFQEAGAKGKLSLTPVSLGYGVGGEDGDEGQEVQP